jgi:predicted component of type VI protein secretion system
MTIKQHLNLEIEKASPEMLSIFYDFIQFLKQQKIKAAQQNEKKHFLDDVIGIMDNEAGDELAEIVNREFQKIEGEW